MSPSCRQLTAAIVLLALAAGARAQGAAPVTVVYAESAEIVESLPLTGTLTSPRAARLAPEVDGRVATLEVDAGDAVARGDTLLALDDELARIELEQARAAEREAAAELDDARRRLSEARELAERASVPATQVRGAEAEVRIDGALLERRAAETRHRAALVERHRLPAPFDGVVARRMAELGEWVGPGTPVLELVAVKRLRLDLQVPQRYFGRVGPGTPLEVTLDALPDEAVLAEVSEVVPVSDASARTFLARVAPDNAAGHMTPGMSARATLRLGTGRQGVVVPRDALIRYPDGRVTVWVTEGESAERRVTERRVQTGLAFDGSTEIVDGLAAGTPVVVRGNEALQEGQTVRVGEGS